ncbi:MAG TPA: sorbosone dehydrogenase [Azospirillum sp.]|nr:sorbosone dehydrogenase [Azospirillum sp.]
MLRNALICLAALLALPAAAQEVGTRIHVRVRDLPAPGDLPVAANRASGAERPQRDALRVPSGFTATLFAEGVESARNLLVLPNGDVIVAQQKANRLGLLRDADGDGRAERMETYAEGFDQPFGLAFHDGAIYVADRDAVWRLPWRDGATRAPGGKQRVTAEGALGSKPGHSTRSLAFAPDGGRFYVGIGSRGNIGEEEEPRATVQEFSADGKRLRTFAAGLRNPIGIGFRPGTNDLYAVVNERDGLGDQLVPDYFTHLEPGGFYGWPYSYLGANPQPMLADKRPDRVKAAIVPNMLLQAHSAPITFTFADKTNFPDRWRSGAFVALHGSWNSSRPIGYSVVFVPFAGNRPEGGYEVFATGFRVTGDDEPIQAWGRPSGVAVAKDGSLLIADDWGTVWRVAHTGE